MESSTPSPATSSKGAWRRISIHQVSARPFRIQAIKSDANDLRFHHHRRRSGRPHPRRTTHAIRPPRRVHRTQALRRHLRQHRLHADKDQIVFKSRNGLETYLRGMKNCAVFTGHAHFESANQVRVGDDLLTAKEIFVNVGGRALIPDFPGVDSVPWMDNVSILELETLPRHLIVVGGSYVGLEFGQIFRRFGSEVTIIEKSSRLVSREDEDVSAAIKAFLEKEGIAVRLKAECIHLHSHGDDVAVGVNCEDDSSDSIGSHVLLAVGRRPNTDDLGLDRAGIKQDEHGFITVDDQLRTTVPGIWALGDCNGRGAFTHTAYNDYEIVAANLLDND